MAKACGKFELFFRTVHVKKGGFYENKTESDTERKAKAS